MALIPVGFSKFKVRLDCLEVIYEQNAAVPSSAECGDSHGPPLPSLLAGGTPRLHATPYTTNGLGLRDMMGSTA